MAYKIRTTRRFDKELELCLRRGFPAKEFKSVIRQLEAHGQLTSDYKPHKLHGNLSGYWECHIRPDWLLIWRKDELSITLTLCHTGTHADLF